MAAPTSARLTHVALPVANIERSIRWYEQFTPLRCIHQREDDAGQAAWISHPEATTHPFVIVLVHQFANGDTSQRQLGPFGHFGIEMPSRGDVDLLAEAGRASGCLHWEPQLLPDPIGYICALCDPDGNVVEFSHDQRVYDTVIAQFGQT